MKRLILLPILLVTAAPALAQPVSRERWTYQDSDVPVDPAFVFGTLPNGMRYVLRENHTPESTVMVRLRIGSGSLEESDYERGIAHFIEHMAFNGSAHVPEGEMVKLLEREGLAFGADTNASTGFTATTYKLDLPRNDPRLIDTALMLMRETASELSLAPDAIDRERGVILSEKRDRSGYALNETVDQWAFLAPDALYPQRLPIGTDATLAAADAARLRGYYARNYVPGNAVLVVIGAIDLAAVEKAIKARFSDWQPAPVPPEPGAGPVDPGRKGLTDIYIDPALSERVTVTRISPWTYEPDSIAQRRQNMLRSIGYAAVNRRLASLARGADAPFRGAGFGTGDVFEAGRTTNLIVDAPDGHWREGLAAAVREWRQAMTFGFSEAEIAEQVARNRTAQENAAASADTRSNAALVGLVEPLVSDGLVPATPQSSLERFEAFAPSITPEAVLAALRADAAPLDDPLIRFQGRVAPKGGTEALRAAWNAAMAEPVDAPKALTASSFAYTDFGPPGTVVSDTVEPHLGIREVRFANGVRLNLKRTALEKDRIRAMLAVDGGVLLDTRADPLATAMVSSLPAGGLGKHSQDELDTLLAGKSVGLNIGTVDDAFLSSAITTPRDLELQLDLMAAALTDLGYRREGEIRYRREIADRFKKMNATPGGAVGAALGGILSDDDPRFTLQPLKSYQALTYDKLRKTLADPLAHGAIELALVGDLDEEQAIALVGKTLGALPPRAADFDPREAERQRAFTDKRRQYTVTHTGEADQALLRYTWPTTDDRDPMEQLRLELLERVVRLELTDELRERLGQAYSPGASSNTSDLWRGYGTFSIVASVNPKDVPAAEAAIVSVVGRLAREPISADELERARRPMLEAYDNALKSNTGWLALAARAQTRAERIDRFLAAKARLEQIDAADLQAEAARYLAPAAAVEVRALPAAKAPG